MPLLLGYVQESCVLRGSGKGPEGGKGAAVRACEASGCVTSAGCARGAAEGISRPRTGSSRVVVQQPMLLSTSVWR